MKMLFNMFLKIADIIPLRNITTTKKRFIDGEIPTHCSEVTSSQLPWEGGVVE